MNHSVITKFPPAKYLGNDTCDTAEANSFSFTTIIILRVLKNYRCFPASAGLDPQLRGRALAIRQRLDRNQSSLQGQRLISTRFTLSLQVDAALS